MLNRRSYFPALAYRLLKNITRHIEICAWTPYWMEIEQSVRVLVFPNVGPEAHRKTSGNSIWRPTVRYHKREIHGSMDCELYSSSVLFIEFKVYSCNIIVKVILRRL